MFLGYCIDNYRIIIIYDIINNVILYDNRIDSLSELNEFVKWLFFIYVIC